MTAMTKLLTFCMLLIFKLELIASDCTDNTDVGEKNPKDKDKDIDTGTGVYYFVCGDYQYKCCGVVDYFQYYQENEGTIELQIWRLNSSMYYLAGSVSHTVNAGGAKNEETVSGVNLLVKDGDCMGWYVDTLDMVTYKDEGSGETVYYQTNVNTAQPQNWKAETSHPTRNYAMYANVDSDNAPTVTTTKTYYSIKDNATVSELITAIQFADPDGGDELTLTMASNAYFEFSDNSDKTGQIKTHSTTSLMGASNTNQTLVITATDLCEKTVVFSVTVTVVNCPPELAAAGAVSVYEDMYEDITIFNVSCTDPTDSVDVSIKSISPAQVLPDKDFFYVKQENGIWVIACRSQVHAPDGQFAYNTQITYMVEYACTDGKAEVTDTLSVNLIQNDPPEFINLPNTTNINASTTKGSVIYDIKYTDSYNDTTNITCSCGPPTCDIEVSLTGQVQTTADMSDVAVNRYELFCKINDHRNYGIPKQLTLIVEGKNNPPVFIYIPVTTTVVENTAVGTSVIGVVASDVDTNDNVIFWLNSITPGGDAYFSINETSGVISISSALNYETLPEKSYTFALTASDKLSNTTEYITINVIDQNEVFVWNSNAYKVDINENALVGEEFPNIPFAVTDEDPSDSFTCIMDCSPYNGYNSMNSTCQIKVAAVYDPDTDRTLPDKIPCNVTATDTGGNSDITSLTINILDANDHDPRFLVSFYSFSVSPYSAVNSPIGTVAANDSDHGSYGQFSFALDSTNLPYFQINSATGVVSISESLAKCNCTGSTHSLSVVVKDNGGRSTTADILITVLDTTTVVTTITTERFTTYFEYKPNLAIFCLLMVTLFVVMCVTIFVVAKYCCLQSFFPGRVKRHTIRQPERYRDRSNESRYPPERNDKILSIRPVPGQVTGNDSVS